jgi:hypothetical protein
MEGDAHGLDVHGMAARWRREERDERCQRTTILTEAVGWSGWRRSCAERMEHVSRQGAGRRGRGRRRRPGDLGDGAEQRLEDDADLLGRKTKQMDGK